MSHFFPVSSSSVACSCTRGDFRKWRERRWCAQSCIQFVRPIEGIVHPHYGHRCAGVEVGRCCCERRRRQWWCCCSYVHSESLLYIAVIAVLCGSMLFFTVIQTISSCVHVFVPFCYRVVADCRTTAESVRFARVNSFVTSVDAVCATLSRRAFDACPSHRSCCRTCTFLCISSVTPCLFSL